MHNVNVEQPFPQTKLVDSLPSFLIPRIWNNDRPESLATNVKIFKENEKVKALNGYETQCKIKSGYSYLQGTLCLGRFTKCPEYKTA